MSNVEAYCRLCAKLWHQNELTDLADTVKRQEVQNKLSRINSKIDFNEDILPKTVCLSCLCVLESAHDFVIAVETAQTVLNSYIFLQDIKSERDFTDSDNFMYEPPDDGIKVETDTTIFLNSYDASIHDSNEVKLRLRKNVKRINYNAKSVFYTKKIESDKKKTKPLVNKPKTKDASRTKPKLKNTNETTSQIKEEKLEDEQLYVDIEVNDPIDKYSDDEKISDYEPSEKDVASDDEYIYTPKAYKPKEKIYVKIPASTPFSTWKEYTWPCGTCQQTFPSCKELITHSIETHNTCNRFHCNDCNIHKKISTLSQFLKHVRLKHREYLKFSCYICFELFTSIAVRGRHEIQHSTSKNSCKGCHSSFETKQELNDHVKSYFKGKNEIYSLLKEVDVDLRSLTCKPCAKSYTSKYHLALHIATKHKERPRDHICEKCGKGFMSQANLDEHATTHMDSKPFQCKLCPAAFRMMSRLRYHIKVHDNIDYPCETCGKAFKRPLYLKRHMLTHSEELPWVCDICDKRFKRRDFLRAHKSGKHSTFKKYTCDICHKSDTNWPNFNKHMTGVHGRDMSKHKRVANGRVPVDPETGQLILYKLDEKEVQEWKNAVESNTVKRRKAKLQASPPTMALPSVSR